MPNAVKRKFVLRGDAAVSLAALFGINEANHSSCLLQLGENDALAALSLDNYIKGLPDSKEALRKCYNLVEFSVDLGPALSISPYWLDLGTQEPSLAWDKPGGYSFGSQSLSLELTEADPWARLIGRVRATRDWRDRAPEAWKDLMFSRLFSSSDGTKMTLEVYRLNGSYRSEITAWPKQPGLTGVTRGYPITTWLELTAVALLGLLLYLLWRRSRRPQGGP